MQNLTIHFFFSRQWALTCVSVFFAQCWAERPLSSANFGARVLFFSLAFSDNIELYVVSSFHSAFSP